MSLHLNNKYVRWGFTAFCVIAASILFYYLMFHARNLILAFKTIVKICMPILVGMVLAYILTPVMNHIEYRIMKPLLSKLPIKDETKRNSLTRGCSIFTTTMLCFLIIYAILAMFASQIIPSIMNLVSNFDTYVENVTKIINKMLEDNPDLVNYANKMIDQYSVELEKRLNDAVAGFFSAGSEIIKMVSLGVINVIGIVWNWVVGFIISLYMLASKEKFAGQAKKIAYAVFDREFANATIKNFRFTHKTFIGFFTGKVLDSIIIGLLCFIGTTILRTPYAALVSVIIGITNIIPFFGPALGAVPSVILVLLVDPMHPLNAVYLLVFILILQQLDGNVIGPKILGESTGLTGFWVIFAITLFGGAFGVLGMVVGVPIFAIIYAGIRALVDSSLEKKSMTKDTSKYVYLDAVDEAGNYQQYVPEYIQKIDEQRAAKKAEKQQKQNNK